MYHPDRNPNANQDKFKQMTAAYTVLSNDKTKARYDNTLRGASHSTPFSSNSSSRSASSHSNSKSEYWSNYGSNSSYKSGNNFYGYYKDPHGNFYNAKDAYQRTQDDQKFKEQAQQSYEQWYQDMKKKKRENETRYQRTTNSKYQSYRTYEDFRADFERQFREKDEGYRQNFTSSDYNNPPNPGESQWRDPYTSQRDERFARMRYEKIYYRILTFIFCFFIIEMIIRRFVNAKRYDNMMRDMYSDEFYPSLGRNNSQAMYMTLNSSFGPQAYQQVPERYQSSQSHMSDSRGR